MVPGSRIGDQLYLSAVKQPPFEQLPGDSFDLRPVLEDEPARFLAQSGLAIGPAKAVEPFCGIFIVLLAAVVSA
jgi:hypothetical protein